MKKIELWKLNVDEVKQIHLEQQIVAPDVLTLDAVSHMIPGGAYTTFRTYQHNKVLRLQAHFERLEETARLAGVPIDLPALLVRETIRKVIDLFHANDSRIRLTVDLEYEKGTIYLAIERLKSPEPDAYMNGVKVITQQLHRDNPKAKLTRFITIAEQQRHKMPEGVNEIIMIDENGDILEGLSSNFFAVKNGEVWTAEEGVLDGITRQMILEEITCAGIKLNLSFVNIKEISLLEECFITSASRAVLPVIQIDEKLIGTGVPGLATKRLSKGYTFNLMKNLEDI